MTRVDLNFDPDQAKSMLEALPWEPAEPFLDGDATHMRRIFLGTVFRLCPSGKYYMPWACSNVDPCPRCEGSGKSIQPPQLWPTCKSCEGRGWRHIGKLAHLRNETYNVALAFLKENGWHTFGKQPGKPDKFKCRFCEGLGQVQPQCSTCEGLGSEEAYLDQLWWEQAEGLFDSHEFTVESGEWDPCDIFAAQYREDPNDDES